MHNYISLNNKKYPKLLKEIPDAPKGIYYKGNWNDEIFDNCLAVVGTRRITEYGKQVIEKLVTEIAGAGITIVSGFMYGVDVNAHKSALAVGGKTIVVMPAGINVVHPTYQENVYTDILENNGLIISEWEGDYPPSKWTYPRRNRIVAGLSKATLIIEGAKKSGSLITADLTLKFNRQLFTVPGPITSTVSDGTNLLLKNKKANLVTQASDIINFYFGGKKENTKNTQQKDSLDNISKKIINSLGREPMSADDLSRNLSISSKDAGVKISMLELQSRIKEKQGKYYVN